MQLWTVFLTGLLAGGASCAAVQGGLLTGLLTRRGAAALPEPIPQSAQAGGAIKARGRTKLTAPKPAPAPVRAWRDDAAPVTAFGSQTLLARRSWTPPGRTR